MKSLKLLIAAFGAASLLGGGVGADETEVLYDNFDDPGSGQGGVRYLKFGPDGNGGNSAAQKFTAGVSGQVSSVTIGLARLGQPGGELVVSIREVNASDLPGPTIGILGSLEINSLQEVIWTSLPPKLSTATVTGTVDGLAPGEDYYLVVQDNGAINDATRGWLAQTAVSPEGADPVVTDVFTGNWGKPWNERLHARIEATSPCHTLTIPDSTNGSVTVSPIMDLYPAGTEITLTATPNDGYEFDRWYDWSACQEKLAENPYTFTINTDTNLAALFTIPAKGIIHHDTLNNPGCNPKDRTKDGRHFKAGPRPSPPGDGGVAQRFTAGESGVITDVTVGLARLGEPGGKLIASIHEVNDSAFPGQEIAVLGELEINSLTEVIWGALPPRLDTATFTGLVNGLTPGEQYFLVLDHTDDTIIDEPRGWIAAGVPAPSETADPFAIEWGSWQRIWTESHAVGPMELHARIEGAPPASYPIPRLDFEGGTIALSPDMDTYPAGTEVILTSTPTEGYEFVKWLYGDAEILDNPATIIVESEAELTPVFAKIETPQPLNINIAQAVVVSWDSQANKLYQIHTSTDMNNWEVAVENIDGTGGRLTQCFIREKTETFYRVEEMP